MEVKSEEEQAVVELFDEWGRDFQPNATGPLAGYLHHAETNPDDCLLVVSFADRHNYQDNAQSSNQQDWYQRERQHLTEDPLNH